MNANPIHRGSHHDWAPALVALFVVAAALLAAPPVEAQRGHGGAGHHGFGHGGHAGHGFGGLSGPAVFGHRGFFPGSHSGGRFHGGHFGRFGGGFGHPFGAYRFGLLSFDRSFFFAGSSRFGRHPGGRFLEGRTGFAPVLYGVYAWGDAGSRRGSTDVYSRAAAKPGPYVEFGGHRVRNLAYERSLAAAAEAEAAPGSER